VISCLLSKLLVKTVYERRRGEVGKWEVGKWGSEEMGRINRVC